VQRGKTVVREGELTWPPPPVEVSAAPAVAAPAAVAAPEKAGPMPDAQRFRIVAVAAVLFFLVVATAPDALIDQLFVFSLAIVVGYYVIGHVHHALHTPLMSVTNAISGIIVVGGLLQVGQHDDTITVVSTLAILLASINIFGGFAVTRRMLAMFTRS
jgi:NAD(P) transhydrogenase subunit alpha